MSDLAALLRTQRSKARLRPSTADPGFGRMLVLGISDFANGDPSHCYSAPNRVSRTFLSLWPLGHIRGAPL